MINIDKINFDVIQCKDHIYISLVSTSDYSGTQIEQFQFDGVQATKTYKPKWYKLPSIPTSVEKKQADQYVNKRYELKAGYPENELTPRVIKVDSLCDTQYEEVSGLYSVAYDMVAGGWASVPFAINIIYKKDDFEWVKANYPSKHATIDEIEFCPALLQERPCCINSCVMFSVIREFVKKNINRSVATIVSDYDFHFEVKRKIFLAEPYDRTYDANQFTKRRKPDWVTKHIASKEETILNLKRDSTDKSYGSDCVLAPTIYGDNQSDLDAKIQKYLSELMADINTKYCECPHCKGWGVVRETVNVKEDI